MNYIRRVDLDALKAPSANSRLLTYELLGPDSGAQGCIVTYAEIQPGPAGVGPHHTHSFQQNFYILRGVMEFVIDGQPYRASPGAFVVIPAGVPHKNWAAGTEPVGWLSIEVPGGAAGEPAFVPVQESEAT